MARSTQRVISRRRVLIVGDSLLTLGGYSIQLDTHTEGRENMNMEQQREALVIAIADRYFAGKGLLDIIVPSLEDTQAMLTTEKPLEWWGNAQDVYKWSLRARDEILQGKNYMARYMASKGLA